MNYERRLSTIASLSKELVILDADAGVRVQGKLGGKACFAFVTKSANKYTVVVYSIRPGTRRIIDKPLVWKEYSVLEEVVRFLSAVSTRAVEAYVY